MASSNDSIFGITTQILTIPATIGTSTPITNAILINGGAGVRYTLLKYASGGSLLVFGNQQLAAGATSSISTTFQVYYSTSAAMQLGYSNAYMCGTTEELEFNGPTQFYVAATGTTCLAFLLQGMSQSLPSFN